MRRVTVQIPSGTSLRAVDRLRLYGPDGSGLVDTTVIEQRGEQPAFYDRGEQQRWLEAGWMSDAWARDRRGAEWIGIAWLSQAWLAETEPVELVGQAHEYGVFQYGVRVVDEYGNQSASLSTGTVFVNAAPAEPVQSGIAVAGGIVSMTITPRP